MPCPRDFLPNEGKPLRSSLLTFPCPEQHGRFFGRTHPFQKPSTPRALSRDAPDAVPDATNSAQLFRRAQRNTRPLGRQQPHQGRNTGRGRQWYSTRDRRQSGGLGDRGEGSQNNNQNNR